MVIEPSRYVFVVKVNFPLIGNILLSFEQLPIVNLLSRALVFSGQIIAPHLLIRTLLCDVLSYPFDFLLRKLALRINIKHI